MQWMCMRFTQYSTCMYLLVCRLCILSIHCIKHCVVEVEVIQTCQHTVSSIRSSHKADHKHLQGSKVKVQRSGIVHNYEHKMKQALVHIQLPHLQKHIVLLVHQLVPLPHPVQGCFLAQLKEKYTHSQALGGS